MGRRRTITIEAASVGICGSSHAFVSNRSRSRDSCVFAVQAIDALETLQDRTAFDESNVGVRYAVVRDRRKPNRAKFSLKRACQYILWSDSEHRHRVYSGM
jgi:hypothetical protein